MGARLVLLITGKPRPPTPPTAVRGAGRSAPRCSTGSPPARTRRDIRRHTQARTAATAATVRSIWSSSAKR
jgi:hypothetical protein